MCIFPQQPTIFAKVSYISMQRKNSPTYVDDQILLDFQESIEDHWGPPLHPNVIVGHL